MAALQVWPLAAAAAAAFLPRCVRFFAAGGRSHHLAVLGLWLLGKVLAVAVQTKFYDYQFLLTLPPMCVLAALAVRFHAGRLAAVPMAARATALVLGFMAAASILHHTRFTVVAHSQEDVPRAVARVLAAEMSPGDRIYVVNYEPIIYFLAGSPLPTKYAYPSSLVGPHNAVIGVDARAENRRILEGKPRFVVVNASWRDDPISWDAGAMTLAEETLARHYAPLAAWVQAKAKGTVRLFVRRD